MDSDIADLEHSRVARVTVTHHDRAAGGGPCGEERRSSTTYLFDPHGRLTERELRMGHGLSSLTRFSYDALDRITEAIEEGTNPDGTRWTSRTLKQYDDAGRLAEEQRMRGDGFVLDSRRPRYASDGTRIEEAASSCRAPGRCGGVSHAVALDDLWLSFDSPRARTVRAVYLPSGSPRDITFSARFGRAIGKVLFETDGSGHVTRVESYGQLGHWSRCEFTGGRWLRPFAPLLFWWTIRVVNMWSRWNLVRRHEWRKLGRSIFWGPPFDETILRYDHTGRRVGQREIILGTLHSSEGWLYDDAGRVVEHRFCDEQDQLVSLDAYTYRTNERGDWIERLMNRSRPDGTDEFVQKTTRAIEYAM